MLWESRRVLSRPTTANTSSATNISTRVKPSVLFELRIFLVATYKRRHMLERANLFPVL